MASETDIANLAISHAGVGKEIANLATEKSEEASTCRRFFDTARDATLRDFDWPFATKITALSLIEEEPNDEWAYSYRYPSDCLNARRILSGVRNDNIDSKIRYRIANDGIARILYTDKEDAQLEYTLRVEDPSFYPIDFILAFSFRLTSLIASRLTKGDPYGMRNKALEMYMFEIEKAEVASAQEEQEDKENVSDLERSRG